MGTGGIPTAGIYFSHYECLGHTSRVMAVGEIFKQRFPSGKLFFIQAGAKQTGPRIGQLGKVHTLPSPFMGRDNFRRPLRGPGADLARRRQICKSIITRQRPDLLITEFFPLGWEQCRHELIPALGQARRQGAVLWSVAGYPLLTGTSHPWRQKLIELYQQIIIFSPSQEKDLIAAHLPRPYRVAYLDFFEKNSTKIVFAGYLLPSQGIIDDEKLKSPVNVPPGACRVAVLRGAGAYYPKLIAQAIRASDLLGDEFFLTVIAGPSTSTEEWRFFTGLVDKKKVNNLKLLRSTGQYEKLIEDSDLCVSSVSYHTSVMLLKHAKRAVLVPFEGQGILSMHEQPARAAMLKEFLGAEVLSMGALTADLLAATIKKTAAKAKVKVKIPGAWMAGGKVLDKALRESFK